jgi:predicted DNA-binding transcriptional regulator AlpA
MNKTTTNTERYINLEEAAQFLSTNTGWIYSNHKILKIPTHYLGRKLRFKISELDNWMKENNCNSH